MARGDDGAPGVTRRVVRLLVLLGVVGAAYVVLSLFDHAAWADAGSTDPVASVKAVAAGAGKAIPGAKSSIAKSSISKSTAHPQRTHRPTTKMPEVRPPKVQAPKKIQEPRKIQAPSVRAGEAARRVKARTSELRQHTSGAVRDAVTPARTAVVRQVSIPAQLPSLRELAQAAYRLPDLPQVELPVLQQLKSWPPQLQLPARPQVPVFALARTPATIRTAASPYQPLMPSVSAQVCPLPHVPASGLSDPTKPPAAQAQPRTAPLPAPPRQPADRSTPTGQARDSGGGNAPVMGTVASSWRPDVAAAGCRPATDLIARGRTVRYAGPPS